MLYIPILRNDDFGEKTFQRQCKQWAIYSILKGLSCVIIKGEVAAVIPW